MNNKMAINIYFPAIEAKENKKKAEQKQYHRHRESSDGCQMREETEGWVKKVKGLRNTNWSSGQDGGIDRNPWLLPTSKRRITTNLKSRNNQKHRKIKLHRTLKPRN